MGRKKEGHYCFGCGQYLANEKFSGKGHRKHICKKCQKSGKRTQNKRESNFFQEWDKIFESDENFAFIAGYTEAGFPYGVTYEDEDGYEEYQKSIDDLLIKIDKFIEQVDENN